MTEKSAAADAPKTKGKAAAAEASEKYMAAERLREMEDEWLGEDTRRHEGKIERGYGSRYQDMSKERRAHHTALENEAQAEAKVVAAEAALAVAKADLERTRTITDATGEALEKAEK